RASEATWSAVMRAMSSSVTRRSRNALKAPDAIAASASDPTGRSSPSSSFRRSGAGRHGEGAASAPAARGTWLPSRGGQGGPASGVKGFQLQYDVATREMRLGSRLATMPVRIFCGRAPVVQDFDSLVATHGAMLVFVATLAARAGLPVPAAPLVVIAASLH